jgi:Ca-activated chloride channel homolog
MTAGRRWSGAVAVAAMVLLALLAGPASRLHGQSIPSFRTGIDVVSLNVTVTDVAGHYISDLGRDQLHVFEDGVQQTVQYFSRGNVPIALALLLDTSDSMDTRMAAAQEAAVGFAERLRPQDVGELVDFDRDVKILQGFTSDRQALIAAIRKTTAGGSTSLYNAIYVSLKELKKARAKDESDVRRQAIVVFSDGEDTSSLVPYEDVLDLAKRSEIAIYTIGLRTPEEATAHRFNGTDFVLRQLAQETGARSFFPTRIEDLSGVYAQIADEIASQYALGYLSKNPRRDGAWRRIVVRADREGARTRTRAGYFGPR